jgi:hypothetical protein
MAIPVNTDVVSVGRSEIRDFLEVALIFQEVLP